jgi:hypothetical protein
LVRMVTDVCESARLVYNIITFLLKERIHYCTVQGRTCSSIRPELSSSDASKSSSTLALGAGCVTTR